jgi:hypothetical protein
MGATYKNGSYLRKATTLILWLLTSVVNLMTTIVRETGIHQPHVWNKHTSSTEPVSRTRLRKVGLDRFDLTMPRHKKYTT